MFNLDSGCVLADFQQETFDALVAGKPIPAGTLPRLRGNLWVRLAERIAPCNLVVRHYCLEDLISGKTDHYYDILDLVGKITYSDTGLWAEGYSYWQYVKPFILQYQYDLHKLFAGFITNIDFCFQRTAYLRDGVMYPAPYGDLRDVPLEPALQDTSKMQENVNIFPVRKTTCSGIPNYCITAAPVGCNTHAPKVDSNIAIADGKPYPFTFYADDGSTPAYIAKYSVNGKFSRWKELLDVLAWKRIKTLF